MLMPLPVVWQQTAAVYLPVAACALSALLQPKQPRRFAACLLGFLWTTPCLVVLQRCNQTAGWWSFAPGTAVALRGMPLEMLTGWAILWGILPQLALAGIGIARSAVVLTAFDLLTMPLLSPALVLHKHWLVGEALAVGLVLLPALCLGEWTRQRTHLLQRAIMQVLTAALVFLFLVPEIIFAARPHSRSWKTLSDMPAFSRHIALEAVLLLTLPGVSAVLEFATRGGGTPIPYDPPVRLVTSGIYRYCRNPMQLFCVLTLFAWAVLLGSGWMAGVGFIAVFYSAGIARWDEENDLEQRFSQPWRNYRSAVGNWIPNWRPYHEGEPARLYMARGCEPCFAVRQWIVQGAPRGLHLLDAELLSSGSIRRMRYVPGDGCPSEEGVRAMARAMEHLHLGWALCGCILRLPGVWQLAQLTLDASGLGKRSIRVDCTLHQ